MLDVNQIFLLHYAIELHVALVLFPNISRIHGYIAVTSYSHTDCCRRTASENWKEREYNQQNGICLRHWPTGGSCCLSCCLLHQHQLISSWWYLYFLRIAVKTPFKWWIRTFLSSRRATTIKESNGTIIDVEDWRFCILNKNIDITQVISSSTDQRIVSLHKGSRLDIDLFLLVWTRSPNLDKRRLLEWCWELWESSWLELK